MSNVTFNPFFADIWDHFAPSALGWAVLVIIATLTIAALVLTVWTLARNIFRRNPPIDQDLRELEKKLAGLAPAEQVKALVDRLANAATKDEITKIREDMKGYVDQAQMDRRIGEVKDMIARTERDLTQQLKELRAYLHEDVHGFREMAQATWATAAEQREGLNNRMNVLAEAMSEVRGWLRAKFKEDLGT
jgi:DNA anti-recombination protein RmuC